MTTKTFFFNLLISLTFLLNMELKAQNQETQASKEETIQARLNQKEYTIFTPDQVRWFQHEGFSTEKYDWNNPEINLHLYKGKRLRKGSRFVGKIGLLTTGIGLLYAFTAVLAEDEHKEETKDITKNIFIASGVIFSSAIALRISSNKKIGKANKLRLSLQ